MTQYPDIYVLRHGQTVWNLEGRLQGREDSALTALGERQAHLQGEILQAQGCAGLGLSCYSSPLGRAAGTADIAMRAIGLPVTTEKRLVEVGFGDWEGRSLDEIHSRGPGTRPTPGDAFSWFFRAPSGERHSDVVARVRGFLDQLDGPSIVVTHGVAGRVLRGVWLGLDEAGMGKLPGGQGCVFRLAGGRHDVLHHAAVRREKSDARGL